jgi:hypothetical protein
MWYKEKRVKEIQALSGKLIPLLREGDKEGARMVRDKMILLYREEIQWIINEVKGGRIRGF